MRGDEEAFAMLVARHQQSIQSTVARLLGYASGDVDDLVQDVFFAAWRGRGGLRDGTSFAAWLRSIAVRRCRTHVTRRARRRTIVRMLTLGAASDVIAKPTGPVVGESSDPALQAALASLTHDHREVIVLRHLEGLTSSQIATACGLTRGAVDARLHRARAALRLALGDAPTVAKAGSSADPVSSRITPIAPEVCTHEV